MTVEMDDVEGLAYLANLIRLSSDVTRVVSQKHDVSINKRGELRRLCGRSHAEITLHASGFRLQS